MNEINDGVVLVEVFTTVTCWTMYVKEDDTAMFCSPNNDTDPPFTDIKFVFGLIHYGEFAVPGWMMKVNIQLCWGVVGRSVIARVVVVVEFEMSV